MININILEKVDTFKRFSDEQLQKVSVISEEIEFQRGDVIFSEGEDARHLFFIIEGCVDLRSELPSRKLGQENTVRSLSSDDDVLKTFGWSCFIPPNKMRLSAHCTSRTCRIAKIDKNRLAGFFNEDTNASSDFFQHLVGDIGSRFHQFQDTVARNKGTELMYGW